MITPGGGRLLPASIPFRFLAAALVFHLAGWTALAAGAPVLATAAGGLIGANIVWNGVWNGLVFGVFAGDGIYPRSSED